MKIKKRKKNDRADFWKRTAESYAELKARLKAKRHHRVSLLFPLALALAFLVGCTSTSPLAPAFVKGIVTTGVSVGLNQAPSARPEVQAAGTVICAAAATTNVEPSVLVSQLEASGIGTNAEAVAIMNGVIGVYDVIFESYGSNWVASTPALELYLQAVCDGVNSGLAIGAPGMRSKPLPPHIRKK